MVFIQIFSTFYQETFQCVETWGLSAGVATSRTRRTGRATPPFWRSTTPRSAPAIRMAATLPACKFISRWRLLSRLLLLFLRNFDQNYKVLCLKVRSSTNIFCELIEADMKHSYNPALALGVGASLDNHFN